MQIYRREIYTISAVVNVSIALARELLLHRKFPPSHWTLTLINEIHGRLRRDVRQTRKKPFDCAWLRHVLTDFNRADDKTKLLPASRTQGLHCELETLGVEKGLLKTYKKSPQPRYPLIDSCSPRAETHDPLGSETTRGRSFRITLLALDAIPADDM